MPRSPVIEAFRTSWRDMIRVVCMSLMNTIPVVATVFGAAYAVQPAYGIGFHKDVFLWIPVLGNILAVVVIPIVGCETRGELVCARTDRYTDSSVPHEQRTHRERNMTASTFHEPPGTHQSRKAAASGWIGSALEYYDFFIYATAAALIFPQIFFPSENPKVAIIASLATYGVGYVARPIGAFVLGHWGDTHGRKNVLILCMFLMGISTMAGRPAARPIARSACWRRRCS